MGDLNIYRDFEWPMDVLEAVDIGAFDALQPATATVRHSNVRGGAKSSVSALASAAAAAVGCGPHWDPASPKQLTAAAAAWSAGGKAVGGFVDAWAAAGRGGGGGFSGKVLRGGKVLSVAPPAWTFPNLPQATNDPARCDRILFRSAAPGEVRSPCSTSSGGTSSGGSGGGDSGGGSSSGSGGGSGGAPAVVHAALAASRAAIVGCGDVGAGVLQKDSHGNPRGVPLRISDHRAVVVNFLITVPR